MKTICNFIPPKNVAADIECFHFVYETNFRKLHQPFMHPNFYAHLAFVGSGILKTGNKEFALAPGTLFFTFPSQSFEIDGDDNFTYFYISFNGAGVDELLKNFNISNENCVFQGFEHLLNFWISSVRRITHSNANTLTESVLLHSLSYINTSEEYSLKDRDRFESIIEYINNNFTDPNISITKIADIFFYNKRYLSSLFTKRINVKFTDYLNNLRIQHAIKLIKDNSVSVSEIASKCGFSDPFYFTKVFKKFTDKTPTEFMKDF